MNNTEKRLEEFVEEGANLEHQRWARWHKYSRLMATPSYIEMWDRKAEMPYIALTNEEQESDRKETRNYLPLLEKAITQTLAEDRKRVRGIMQQELKLLSSAYAGLETLPEKSANLAIRDSFIRILSSLDKPDK